MNIVFLDIDGVLVTWDSQKQLGMTKHLSTGREMNWRHHRFHPGAVDALNKLTRDGKAVIVVSSTWRNGSEDDFAEIVEYIRDQGVQAEIIGRTPRLIEQVGLIHVAKERGHEIQAWLDDATVRVDKFVIIDDDSDMVHLSDRLVKTSMETGFTQAHCEKALRLLV